MSATIDERVVSMHFDNKHFESNVRTSMSTLDKLKQSLNLTGAAKGLDNITSAAKKVDMSSVGHAAETVGLKFNAMYTMADQALRNITNSAINAGKRIVSALTIDPVKTGFSEYETKIGSIQTIMSNTASKGTTMADVTRVIDELNTYADKTIYNFAEMTRNIGTFTAAGVGLEDSAAAIKGIANLAAASGSTSQQASTAMYQLSQALAAGTVKLMDWNSVVNAGMGGEKFQEALKATAREHGVAVDDMIKKAGSFRESLQDGWITADILNETLNKFTVDGAKNYAKSMMDSGKWTQKQADALIAEAQAMEDAATKVKTFTQLWDTLKESAQSGWGKTWELIVGDFDQAKELWTKVSDVLGGIINDSSDARNKVLEGALSSNWDRLVKQLNSAGVEMSEFEKSVKKVAKEHNVPIDRLIEKYGSFEKALRSGAVSADIMKEAVDKLSKSEVDLSNVSKNLKKGANGEDVKKIQQALKNLDIDISKYGVDGKFGKYTEKAVKEFQKLHGLKVTGIVDKETLDALEKANSKAANLGDTLDDLIDGITELGGREKLIKAFGNVFKGLAEIIKPIKNAFGGKDGIFPPMTAEQLYNLIDGFEKLTERFRNFFKTDSGKQVLENLGSTFKGLFSVIDIGLTVVKEFGKGFAKVFGSVLGLGGGVLSFTGKIGEGLTALRNWIKDTGLITAIVDGVVSALQNGIQFIKKFGSYVKNEFLAFLKTDSPIGNYFADGVTKIKEFIDKLKSIDSFSLDNLETIFKDFKNNVVDYFTSINIEEAVGNIKNGLKSFKNSAAKYLDAAGEKFSSLKDKLVTFAEFIKSKLPAAIAIGMGVLLIKSLSKLGKALEILANPLDGLKEMFDGLVKSFVGLNKAKAFETRTEGIKNLAIALGILAASLTVLTLLDHAKMWSAVGAIAALAVVLGVLSFVAGKMGNIAEVGKAAIPMLALSGALLILVSCLKNMEGLNGDTLWKNVLVLGAMAVGLATIVGVLGRLAPSLSKSSLTFLAIAAGLKIMVGTLEDIDKMSFDNLERSITVLLGIIGSLILVTMASKGLSVKSAIGLIGMVISIKLLVGALEDIAEFDFNKIKSNIESFILVIGTLMVLMATTSLAGSNAAAGGIGILAMSLALMVIVKAMKGLSEIDQGTISRSADAISKMILVFGAVMVLSKFAGTHGASAALAMLGMSAALILLTGVIVILKDIDPNGLDRAIAAISKVVLIFSVLVASTHLASSCIGTLIVLTIAVTILSAAVAGLSFISPDGLQNAVTAVAVIMGMLALVVASTKFATGSVGTLIVMTAAIGILAGVIYLLNKIPIENTIGIVASLSTLILSLSAACAILSMVPIMGALTGIGSLAILIAGVGLIMAAISGLNALMPGMDEFLAKSLPTLELIGSGLGTFFGSIVGGFAEGITSSLPQIGKDLSDFMTNLTPFLDGIKSVDASALTGVDTIADIILKLTAADVLQGLTSWITGGSTLTSFASELETFGASVASLSTTLSSVDDSSIVKMDTLAAVIDKFVEIAGKVPETGGLAQAIAGAPDLVAFAKGLGELGASIGTFASSVVEVTDDDISKMTKIGEAIQPLVNVANAIPAEGGWADKILGAQDLSAFAAGFGDLGSNIASFAASVVEITDDDISKMAKIGEAIQPLVNVANAIPAEGGFADKILGAQNLGTFAAGLTSLGASVSSFTTSVSDITEEDTAKISNIKTLVDKFVELAGTIPPEGGLAQAITGTPSLTSFAGHLTSLGSAIATLSSSVSEVTVDDVTKIGLIGNAVSALVTASAGLKDYDGGTWFNTNLVEFAGQLEAFGQKMSAFAGTMAGVDFSNVGIVSMRINGLVSLATTIAAAGDPGATLISFGDSLVALATDLSAFCSSTAGLDFSGIGNIQAAINELGAIDISGLGELSSLGSKLKSIATQAVDDFITPFTNAKSKFTTAGKNLMDSLAKGIKNGKTKVETSAGNVAKSAKNAVEDYKDDFETAGGYLAAGLAQGIRDGKSSVINAAIEIAEAAVAAAEEALGIQSPSKVFHGIGEFVVRGFVNALGDGERTVYKSSRDMADYAKRGFTNAISKVSDILNNSIDDQLTIRPVLDLSDVSAGANMIGSMLGINPSIGVLSNVGTISSMMNRRQNGVNRDVVSAIKDLGSKLDNAAGNTYNYIDGVSYDDGSNVSEAVRTLVRAAKVERRV